MDIHHLAADMGLSKIRKNRFKGWSSERIKFKPYLLPNCFDLSVKVGKPTLDTFLQEKLQDMYVHMRSRAKHTHTHTHQGGGETDGW